MLLHTWLACARDPAVVPEGPTATGDTGGAHSAAPPTDPTGACGPPVPYDLTLIGTVVGPYGTPAPGAAVRVEDRGWQPGRILGEGVADAEGAFTLPLPGVISVEGCWATLLDYVLVGERAAPGGDQSGELDLNTALYAAIEDGTLVADLGSFPLTLLEVP